ncbi:MAG: hypothetical protein F6K50_03030 [Moorea sp. SIO3I7]|uniref:glycosyltransferase family 39 protein n=1 Tax=Moorena sp. SIO3I8 TaxID=2607833 RepID=UPI0013C1D480|nr:glycosyltransferase family 39 protein [Moorena sp. SIO3I8]NEN94534.1 hypothetical protein [Moorena sp. SIO3I7]NEO06955.1 hypothetical protein [Moorena sp. SIO3I8]
MKSKTQSFLPPLARVNSLQEWIPITLILLLAVTLYFYQLGTESLWIDELYSIHDAKAIPEKLRLTRPLYFILLRLWMFFGESDVWLRGLSIPFGLGSVFLTYCLGRRLVGQRVGLIAALLVTLSPVFINHAQEVRMYSLSTFLGLVGTLALTHGLERMTTVSISCWLIARLLATLTTPLNCLLLLPDCLLLVWKFRKRYRVLLGVGAVLLVVGIVSLPWIFQVATASSAFFDGWTANNPKPTLVNVLSRLTIFTAYWPLKSLQSSVSEHFYKLYTIMLAGLLGFSLFNRQLKPHIFWLAAWGFLPTAVLFIMSWIFSPVWLPRYLLFIAPYLLILLAVGFSKIWHRARKLGIAIALMYFVAVGGGLEHYYTKVYRHDWRSVSQMITINEQPEDVIALHIGYPRPRLALNHYYQGSAPIQVLDLEEWEQSLSPFPSRLWLVHNNNRNPDSTEQLQNELRKRFQIQNHQVFKNEIGYKSYIDVFLVTPKDTETALD